MFSKNKKIIQIGGVIFLAFISLAVGLIFMWQRSSSTTGVAEATLVATATLVDSGSPTQTPETLPAPTETPSPSPEPTDIPAPNMITVEPHTVEITREPIVEDGKTKEERYTFSEPVRIAEILPNGKALGFTGGEFLSIIDVDEASIAPFVGDISPIILVPFKSDHIFVAVQVDAGQQFPIWAINSHENEPVLLGTTTGIGPLYSATTDGKILLLEEGHLVLKWIEGNTIQSQSLEIIEQRLELNWDQIDFKQKPYYDNVPLIDISISPDGQWLALFDGIRSKLWIISIDGQTVHDVSFPSVPVAPGEGPWVKFLAWSPDSQRLGYRASVWFDVSKPYSSEGFNLLQIISVNPDTNTNPTTLIELPLHGITMAWSPNSEHLAFTASDSYLTHPTGYPVDFLFVSDGEGANVKIASHLHAGDSIKSLYWDSDNATLRHRCQDPDSGKRGICTIVIQ